MLISATACSLSCGRMLGQQDVGHGVVATGRGALRLRSLIATLRGLIYSLFLRDIEFSSSNHTARRKCLHFRGVEQASAPIYINGLKNTEFFKNYTKQTPPIFVKSTRVIFLITLYYKPVLSRDVYKKFHYFAPFDVLCL